MPTGRAPRRASQAETYAVPQPSSIVSCPATSGRIRASDSGMPQMPQCGSACQSRRPDAAYSLAHRSQTARLRAT